MEVVSAIPTLRTLRKDWASTGASVGLAMSTGGLHAGHLSLMEAARAGTDKVIAAIFLPPQAFTAGEPVPAAASDDLQALQSLGVDVAFLPRLEALYPADYATMVSVTALTDVLCGAEHPGCFDAVTRTVIKMFNITSPDRAYFGEKDWQQLQVLRKMIRDLNMDVEAIGCPTVRERNGLALSTRNGTLSREARTRAATLHAALSEAAERISKGTPTELASAEAQDRLVAAGFTGIEYVECRTGDTLRLASAPGLGARVFAAAHLGEMRLIDNVEVPAGPRRSRSA